MFWEKLKPLINERKTTYLVCEAFVSIEITELVDYLNEKNSIVNELIFKRGIISKNGIDYLINNYGNKLLFLSFNNCNLCDKDIENITKLANLKNLTIKENLITEAAVEKIKDMNLENFQYDFCGIPCVIVFKPTLYKNESSENLTFKDSVSFPLIYSKFKNEKPLLELEANQDINEMQTNIKKRKNSF